MDPTPYRMTWIATLVPAGCLFAPCSRTSRRPRTPPPDAGPLRGRQSLVTGASLVAVPPSGTPNAVSTTGRAGFPTVFLDHLIRGTTAEGTCRPGATVLSMDETADGCHHAPIGGLDAVRAGFSALSATFGSLNHDRLGDRQVVQQLGSLLDQVGSLLSQAGPQRAAVAQAAPARKNALRRAQGRLTQFIDTLLRAERRRRFSRAAGDRLLDLARAVPTRIRSAAHGH